MLSLDRIQRMTGRGRENGFRAVYSGFIQAFPYHYYIGSIHTYKNTFQQGFITNSKYISVAGLYKVLQVVVFGVCAI